jgi:putative peptidoglycan lipid II flippase
MASEQHASLARGAALITLATAVSRITGFLRVVAVAAAMGTTFLANTYQTANTAPNILFELVAAGILTSVFVPTFVGYLVREEREEGWRAANVLSSVALAGLIALALLLALAAPLIMRILTIGVDDPYLREQQIALGATFLRLFAPQVAFYGIGMVMTGALHAYRRFGAPAVAPIFNNVVVIIVYVVYAVMRGGRPPTVEGITTAETFVLGVGTTLGVVAMTVCLVPSLRSLGWRFRLAFDLGHPAVKKAARLGVWALGYAGGYQAGLIVVLLLANRVEGGVAAYQWAYTFFYVPHALFAVPIFHVLFPAMSEHVERGESTEFLGRLREGLGMLAFIMIPTAAILAVAAGPLTRVTLEYGVMTPEGARFVGRVLTAFAVGLPTYSAFLVLTRAFYAMSDMRTPALQNALAVSIASGLGALLFVMLPDDWSVAGLAFGHSVAYLAAAVLLARGISRRVGRLGVTALENAVLRAMVLGGAALVCMILLSALMPADSRADGLWGTLAITAVGAAVYVGGMARMGSPELQRVAALVRRRR